LPTLFWQRVLIDPPRGCCSSDGSADRRFCGPRLFIADSRQARTSKTEVRATPLHSVVNRQSKIGNFNGQAVTPTVLLVKEFLNQLPLLAIRVRVKHPSRSSPFVLSNANLDLGVALDILHPVSAVKVLGEKVQLSPRLHEPNLDQPRNTANPASRCQVQHRVAR